VDWDRDDKALVTINNRILSNPELGFLLARKPRHHRKEKSSQPSRSVRIAIAKASPSEMHETEPPPQAVEKKRREARQC
jgi:hypothetical protein